jgi:hypothetical protein
MVELKKKVTLKTKVAETATQNQQTTPQPNPSNNGTGKKFGVLIVVAIIAVVAFFLLKPDNSGNDVSVSSPATSETVAQNADNAQEQEVAQPVSESTSNEESTSVVEEDKSNNEVSDNNGNKPATVSEQEEKTQATTETRTQTKEVTSITTQKEEAIPVGSIEEKAKLVIRGDFGNGEERKMKLGSEYSAIQNKVNEMYAKGLVY